MGSLLKDLYSKKFYDSFSETLEEVISSFNKDEFIQQIFDKNWDSKELKQRMKHTSLVLNNIFPADFSKTVALIEKIIESLRKRKIKDSGLEFMFLPHYIETYGINDYEASIKLMEFVTPFASCEFAVRPFIIKYGYTMLKQMAQWSLHENYHVRRLASEGSRPRLPWAISLPQLKKNPAPILPILENLKNDPSEYVRRSVANNLNDISKDHPDIVIAIAKKWKGHSKETDAIIKHASRTLLKQGCQDILIHFELAHNSKIIVNKFNLLTPQVTIGDDLKFSFSIQNTDTIPLNVRMEYGIHYLRNNGHHTKKVFKISERQLKPAEIIDLHRKQSFRIITTKKFYAGQQQLSLIINGQQKYIEPFELTNRPKPAAE